MDAETDTKSPLSREAEEPFFPVETVELSDETFSEDGPSDSSQGKEEGDLPPPLQPLLPRLRNRLHSITLGSSPSSLSVEETSDEPALGSTIARELDKGSADSPILPSRGGREPHLGHYRAASAPFMPESSLPLSYTTPLPIPSRKKEAPLAPPPVAACATPFSRGIILQTEAEMDVIFEPGVPQTLKLYGRASASGIFAPHDLTVTVPAMELFGYKFPTRFFRVHASPHLAVSLQNDQMPLFANTTAGQPCTIRIDYGRYTLESGTLTLAAPPGVFLATSPEVPGSSALALPLSATDGVAGQIIATIYVTIDGAVTGAYPELAYTVECSLSGVVEHHEQTGLLSLSVVRLFQVETAIHDAGGTRVLHAKLTCTAPVAVLGRGQLTLAEVQLQSLAATSPPILPGAASGPLHAGQRWSLAWPLSTEGGVCALAAKVVRAGPSLTVVYRCADIPAAVLTARLSLEVPEKSPSAIVGQPLCVRVNFLSPAEVVGRNYSVTADACHWLAMGPTRGLVPPSRQVSLTLLPTAPGRHPLPAVAMDGLPVIIASRALLVLVAPDSSPPAGWS